MAALFVIRVCGCTSSRYGGSGRRVCGGTPATSAGVSPSYLDDPAEAEANLRSRCGTKLAPIWAAEEYLADEEWVADHDAKTLDELRKHMDQPVAAHAVIPPGTSLSAARRYALVAHATSRGIEGTPTR